MTNKGRKNASEASKKLLKFIFALLNWLKMVMENSGKSWNLKAGNAYQPCIQDIGSFMVVGRKLLAEI